MNANEQPINELKDAELRKQLELAKLATEQNAGLFATVVDQAPMGVYVVDDQFRLQQVNARALPAFANVDARVGRDFAEVMNILWGPVVGRELSDIFRHTLATGEPYISPRHFTEFRQDLKEQRSYEWETRRVTLPNGKFGVVCYFNDVTEAVRIECLLREAKAAAEAANQSKDQFLATLSHELRTPLMPVLLAAEALREDKRLPADVRDHLSMMERNIALEARLLEDLFDITAITQGKIQLRAEFFDAHSLIALAIEIVREEAVIKDIKIERDFAARHSGLIIDPARFQQVIWNLLRNAVKFTPPGGKVNLSTCDVSSGQDLVNFRIQVTDNGIGIQPEALEIIFRPFEQGEFTRKQFLGGMGLGLAVARAIVDLHRGKIWAQSLGTAKGSTFIVEFPNAVPPKAGVSGKMPPPGQVLPPDITPSEKAGRLLLVEDHAPTLQMLSILLTRTGYEVTAANSIAAALHLAKTHTFDLVVSDLGLPDGTGIELMRELRAAYGLTGVALSGYGMEEDLARAKAAGFVAHLVKPIRIAELKNAINSSLRPPSK